MRSLNGHLERLASLGAHLQSRSAGGTGGRYARKPSFSGLRVRSTRPRSALGVTFHFKHSFVSKTNAVSKGGRSETSAPAHQQYIERRGAAEHDAEGAISFGTLGESKAERAEFWREVEFYEGRKARVQCRVIAELPCEMTAEQRRALVSDFCQQAFGERGLPYWCTVHAPDAKNDKRNYHAHIVYSDRPARRLDDGTWDFAHVVEGRYKNGTKRRHRPFKQNKDPDTQRRGWVRELRDQFATISNAHLEANSVDKRYDPRSYRESGVPKLPTRHLGTLAAHAEAKGLDTKKGDDNARREIAFRLDGLTATFVEQGAYADSLVEGLQAMPAETREERERKDTALVLARQYRSLTGLGASAVRRREAHAIAAELIGERLEARSQFLGKEIDGLMRHPPGGDPVQATEISHDLFEEKQLIDAALEDVGPFVSRCRAIAKAHDKKLGAVVDQQSETLEQLRRHERQMARQRLGVEEAAEEESKAIPDTAKPHDAEGSLDGEVDLPMAAGVIEDLIEDPAFTEAVDERRRMDDSTAETPLPAATGAQEIDDILARAKTANERGTDSDPASGAHDPARDIPAIPGEHPADAETLPDAVSQARAKLPFDGGVPGALFLDQAPEASQREELETGLRSLTNAELRYVAHATQDASDLEENLSRSHGYQRAMQEIEIHARNRGLDLTSGQHDPARANDPEIAELHIDSAIRVRAPREVRRQR